MAVASFGATPLTAREHGADRPVIVWSGSAEVAADAVESIGETVDARLELVGGAAASLDDREILRLRRAGHPVVDDVEMRLSATTSASVPVADLQLAAVNPGNDWDLDAGAGVGVALVDSGVSDLPDLAGRLVHGPDLSGEGTTRDTFGHGTFMAGLIAGDGTMSASRATRHVGVAPGAHIVSVKVAGADGSTSLSRVINGIGWVVENADLHAIRVLNLSLSAPRLTGSYVGDPLSAAVEAAWASGITVVTSAGNDGGVVASPARDPWIITVGALDLGTEVAPHDDSVPTWSSREVTKFSSKPELLAPGVSVVSLAAPGSTVVASHPNSVVDEGYFLGSGTSMAAAMTSGAVAVLTEHHAAATPDDFKGALMSTGRPLPGAIGAAIDLSAADLAGSASLPTAWPSFPIAYDGLDGRLTDRMPWASESTHSASTRWASTRWAGDHWVEHQWQNDTWARTKTLGARWASTRWASTRWAGTGTAGDSWASTRWANELWSSTRWASTRWASTRWAAGSWSSTRWAAAKWDSTRWASTSWDSTRWAGTGWTGGSWVSSTVE